MSVDNSVGRDSLTNLAATPAERTADGEASPWPVPVEPPPAADRGEQGTWFLLLFPVVICVGLLVFSAVFERF